MILILVMMLIYLCMYCNSDKPPLYDIISPLITIIISFHVPIYCSETFVLLMIGLVMDALADYYMDINNIAFPIILFSYGHILKQIAFGYRNKILYTSIRIGLILTTLLALNITDIAYILLYGVLIGLTLLQMMKYQLIGILLFIISDIIICIDMIGIKIHPKQMRVLLVPLLYWISQLIMLKECSVKHIN